VPAIGRREDCAVARRLDIIATGCAGGKLYPFDSPDDQRDDLCVRAETKMGLVRSGAESQTNELA
jgi:hypothetical protein